MKITAYFPVQEATKPTSIEQALIERLNGQVAFQPALACLVCHCRLVRFVFGQSACARCEPGALWSDETVRLLAALDERGSQP